MSSNPILLLGANGQIGTALCDVMPDDTIRATRQELDLSQLDQIEPTLDRFSPSLIVNAAAYTKVDQAEEEKELAYCINAQAVEKIALYCKRKGAAFIHYSTDYVFDGNHSKAYIETDSAAPLSVYGKSKRQGELAIIEHCTRYLILRTAWVYDEHHPNFANAILNKAKKGEALAVVDDQIGTPNHAAMLADYTEKLIEPLLANRMASGIYHLSATGHTSWHGFASALLEHAAILGIIDSPPPIEKRSTDSLSLPAARPRYSILCCNKIVKETGIFLPSWQEGVTRLWRS